MADAATLAEPTRHATISATTRPGDAIRERRNELGWTQAELAEATGYTQADISRIENHLIDARYSTIHRLIEALESPDAEPKRSLANGGRRRPRPQRPHDATPWTPSGPVSAITDDR